MHSVCGLTLHTCHSPPRIPWFLGLGDLKHHRLHALWYFHHSQRYFHHDTISRVLPNEMFGLSMADSLPHCHWHFHLPFHCYPALLLLHLLHMVVNQTLLCQDIGIFSPFPFSSFLSSSPPVPFSCSHVPFPFQFSSTLCPPSSSVSVL